jgi:hypothetical protein
MSTATAEDVVRIKFKGPLARFMKDRTRFIDLEGALNCGKTTACLWKEFIAAWLQYPGIWSFIGRYSDGDNSAKLLPAWERVVREAGVALKWNAKELCYEFPNGPDPDKPYEGGSRVFSFGLKSPDALSRYAKLRGLGVSRIYIDQAEELPPDFFPELVQRLRQSGFPHQLTLSPNPLDVNSWLATEFPEDNRLPNRAYYSISLFDNAHNLPPEKIDDALTTYPPSHAKHRTAILGKRGLNVTGIPVYKDAFIRAVHVAAAEYDPRLSLEVALDFGKHHPCMVFRQTSPVGQTRLVGGILGQNLYLDDFLDIALGRMAEWFPGAMALYCCDPAGMADTSHGTAGAKDVLKAKGIRPRFVENSNSPVVRLACIERMAALMRKRAADRSEAFLVSNSPRWLRVSQDGATVDHFLADGFEAGYVWDAHMVSVDNKQVRRPKKDGWYEHGQNCAEYLELNFGSVPQIKKAPTIAPPKRPMGPPPKSGGMGWAR